ncbi:MAG: ATP-dependent sacrificial sulfur transferase LarE [Acidobacteria bacterium]|nr:ATP-dependent sacrificial sulfur transferase LarE [Acidobacteriota bacterium]
MSPEQKEHKLVEILQALGSAVVAYSGGVDSAYLAYMAHKVLGERSLAVTAWSPSLAIHEKREASAFADRFRLRHEVIETEEMENPQYRSNPTNRCYFCKTELFEKLSDLCLQRGFEHLIYGANVDDLGDFRPGMTAAREYGVRAPLLEAGLTKEEIRDLSRKQGLPTWNKPAQACLSSRFPFGTLITEEKLAVVDQGEEFLRRLGFRVYRVRYHGEVVRIELGREELPRALEPEVSARIAARFKELGFKFVTLDLEGYRSGSLNPRPKTTSP